MLERWDICRQMLLSCVMSELLNSVTCACVCIEKSGIFPRAVQLTNLYTKFRWEINCSSLHVGVLDFVGHFRASVN